MKNIIGFLLMVIAVICSVYIKITNIDMTELRLFVEYSKEYLMILLTASIGYFLMCKD